MEMRVQEDEVLKRRSRPSVSAAWAAPALFCPRCQSAYLHHTDVTVFDQRSFDETTVRRTVIEHGKPVTTDVMDSSASGNPSRDRDGLVIQFYCEECSWDDDGSGNPDEMKLTISQHKGQTFLEWRYTWRKVPDLCPICEGVMVVKYSSSRYTDSQFLGCVKYPTCKGKRPKPDDEDSAALKPGESVSGR